MPGPLVLAAPTVIGGGMSAIAQAAAALGFVGTGALVGKAVSDTYNNVGNNNVGSGTEPPNNKVGSIDQFSDEDLSNDVERRRRKKEQEAYNPTPEAGADIANRNINDPESPYNFNSGFNKNNRNETIRGLDDLESRTKRIGSFNLDNQMKKASFDNAYTGAENMLNRYVQMRQMGANVISNAANQRY